MVLPMFLRSAFRMHVGFHNVSFFKGLFLREKQIKQKNFNPLSTFQKPPLCC